MNNSQILRVPSAEPYGYIEVMFEGTPEEAIVEQKRLARLFRGGVGLPEKDFNQIMENMAERKPNQIDPGILENMNQDQKMIFDYNRKMRARIDYKNR